MQLRAELKQLHTIARDQAQLLLADKTRNRSETDERETRLQLLSTHVAALTARLQNVDEQCFFLKDTLYSLLTVGAGKDGMPKTQAIAASKKPLKPLKAALTAPWSSVTPGQGF